MTMSRAVSQQYIKYLHNKSARLITVVLSLVIVHRHYTDLNPIIQQIQVRLMLSFQHLMGITETYFACLRNFN